MLAKLYIQNIALIQKAEITFGGGLNVFTGETGAGKTMLISAIDAVLGERVSREVVRAGEEKAIITALFEDPAPQALAVLAEMGLEDEDEGILITREVSAQGKSASKVNGAPATAGLLKQLASHLIQIHGQRESGQLLAPERQLEMIDTFAGHNQLLSDYRQAYDHYREVECQKSELVMDEKQKAQRLDMLSYQINEIDGANLDDPGEEDELTARKKLIGAGEKVIAALSAAYNALNGEEEQDGINALFDTLSAGVSEAAEYIPDFELVSSRLNEMGYELAEFGAQIRDELDAFEFDPRELDQIEYRLDQIHKLKRKYGGSIAEIIAYGEKARQELDALTASEEKLAKLEEELVGALERAQAIGDKLTKSRTQAAGDFLTQVQEELAFLDMPGVKLSARIERKPLSPDGQDELTLYVSTNVGEEPGPLAKIASGGEVSRMMLAMKNVLAEKDGIGTLIFDEVDTGVSGRAAGKIGQKLSQASRGRQVIAVTHLAQVAAFADKHMLIRKEVEDGRTYTKVEELNKTAREAELARINSGDNVTATALENARELIEHAKQLTMNS
ncbi:MAG: DNA repair protein RecN [Oscillospiraceae bacterium]|nr:DNA repair protein RecN [Oscillospiraceae bacterium]